MFNVTLGNVFKRNCMYIKKMPLMTRTISWFGKIKYINCYYLGI